jgi:glycosyltransferase involved in cell wall biosynthesis
MASGTPVICSAVHALPEIVGNAGIFVSLHDPEEMYQRAIEVAEQNELRASLILQGRERARLFTWEKCADRLIAAMRAN